MNGRAGTTRARVVIAGGGVAGLEAALALTALAGDCVDVQVVAPEERFVYRPFMVVAAFGGGEPWSYDLSILLAHKDVRHRRDAVLSVDTRARRVRTRDGDDIPYDALLIAMGARPVAALPGALTFAGSRGIIGMQAMLAELERGTARSIAFALPPGVTWGLPLYELALLTRTHLARRGIDVPIHVVSPEVEPLALFGALPSQDVRTLLAQHDISFRTGYPYRFGGETLLLVPEDSLRVDRVVALPAYRGSGIQGIPSDDLGFIPTDELGAVPGVERVWAAGDITDFPIKQGGVATQQADAAATAIAARFGAPAKPRPFRPVLRGIVVGAEKPRHLRAELVGGRGEPPPGRTGAFWWPPAKIAGRYLAPYLAAHGAPRLPADPVEAA